MHVEVTTLLVTGENDSPEDLKGIAGFLASLSPDLVWHVSRYHPDFQMTRAAADARGDAVERPWRSGGPRACGTCTPATWPAGRTRGARRAVKW